MKTLLVAAFALTLSAGFAPQAMAHGGCKEGGCKSCSQKKGCECAKKGKSCSCKGKKKRGHDHGTEEKKS